MNEISSKEIINIIRLIRSENVGNITFFKLLEKFGSVENAINNIPNLAQKGGKRKLNVYSLEKAKQEYFECLEQNIVPITYNHPHYPPLLQTLEDKPPVLFTIGNSFLLKKSAIAIVGARSASLNGISLAYKFAKELGEIGGLLVVSGMAKGIDKAAHEGALQKGTAAFLGGGVNIIYPKENTDLYNKIAKQGVLVSETPVNVKPIASNFPRRNRLISGMCRGVLVVEASLNSGSIITAKSALEQGRDIFAIPYNPNDHKSLGTNKLIKEGAFLTETIEDMLPIIKGWKKDSVVKSIDLSFKPIIAEVTENELSNFRTKILELLSTTPINIDLLIREQELNSGIVSTVLLELELAGIIERFPGNKVALLNKN